jgi:hypothetical protein
MAESAANVLEEGREPERALKVRCHACGEHLDCPPGDVFWAWLKGAAVFDFWKRHEACGGRAAGAEITFNKRD